MKIRYLVLWIALLIIVGISAAILKGDIKVTWLQYVRNIVSYNIKIESTQDDLHDIYRIHFLLKAKTGDIYFADDLNGYGCWCGQTGHGMSVDKLDRCCWQHHMCLRNIFAKKCLDSSRYYSYKTCFFKMITCHDSDPCKLNFCRCDKEAAICLSDVKHEYNEKWKTDSKTYCNDTQMRK
ncbi:phospholipase A2-like isoform X1 [Mytilus galloprovincialis]|uniref:phospholipase A2-like isoform X1 n=2 Tax=Mytilus galloprovincialis TaxID=29158 RepID=UPI003F7CB67A